MQKILIIKLGYSETLDQEIGSTPSWGDVLRTTPILYAVKEKFPDGKITWLTDKNVKDILTGNSFIDRLLVWDQFIGFQLLRERFDVVINLEKIPGICALVDMIDAWTKYGFRFHADKGTYSAYEKGLSFLDYLQDKKSNKDIWQKVLIEMLGVKWNEQEYVLGYTPQSGLKYDIGLNYLVGSKWPNKSIPKEIWDQIAQQLVSADYKISWQEGHDNIFEYIDWINSCRIIISQDSLGLHLAIALKKTLIGIFGPTDSHEIHLYNYKKCSIVKPKINCPHMPCYRTKCLLNNPCLTHITVDDILNAVREITT